MSSKFRIPERKPPLRIPNADYLSTNDFVEIFQRTGIDPMLCLNTHGYAVLQLVLAWWHFTNETWGEWRGITWQEVYDTWPPGCVELYGPDADADDVNAATTELAHNEADADQENPEQAMPDFTEASAPESGSPPPGEQHPT